MFIELTLTGPNGKKALFNTTNITQVNDAGKHAVVFMTDENTGTMVVETYEQVTDLIQHATGGGVHRIWTKSP